MKQLIPLDHIVHYLLDVLDVKPGKLPDRVGNSWRQLYHLANNYKIYYYLAVWSLDCWDEHIPDDLQTYMKKSIHANKTRNILFVVQIERLAQLFREAEIPIMFIKGAACLLRGIYPIETRYLTDLDVIIPKQYIKQSRDLLEVAGYLPEKNSNVPPHHHHIVPYSHPEHIGVIEIHIEPYDRSIHDADVMPDIWNDADIITLQGEQIKVPSINDHIWILIRTSGSGRMFLPRLAETLEMSLFINNNYPIDYSIMKERAERDEMPNIFGGMAYSCSRYFGIEFAIPGNDFFFRRWENWSLQLQRKLLGNVSFLASRKRFGSLTFLTHPGISSKYRLLKWFIHYEFFDDYPHPGLLRNFFPLIKLWRISKNVVTYMLFFIEYWLFRIFKEF
ncbi:MAG: nucleotidyltransferase family protein [Candidatus Latescibacteria bacterium]|nr:nucleotidyltransferase family protein [Candidatus Latescibacterota bacterium]